MPEVDDILLEPRVLYVYVCMVKGCSLVYASEWVTRTYETENEVVSHGLCNEHAAEYEERYP